MKYVALVEHDGRVLLARNRRTGEYHLPMCDADGAPAHERLESFGTNALVANGGRVLARDETAQLAGEVEGIPFEVHRLQIRGTLRHANVYELHWVNDTSDVAFAPISWQILCKCREHGLVSS